MAYDGIDKISPFNIVNNRIKEMKKYTDSFGKGNLDPVVASLEDRMESLIHQKIVYVYALIEIKRYTSDPKVYEIAAKALEDGSK